ncbi:hypothetical protein G5V59_09735 [Nocardioides sp. W3-2-3]|uniref:hypothetical protein n=1 Tax=Nocardioides convexus TaxID=2712224 RepID=UPI0024185B26|nr:hypothetical protein [Nocardioides convexus]NHA00289.1 hypothetical protein [Nocardioides convexus]
MGTSGRGSRHPAAGGLQDLGGHLRRGRLRRLPVAAATRQRRSVPWTWCSRRPSKLDALRTLRSTMAIPYDVAEESAEILPWAISDNGDVCYWVRRPESPPDLWTVVVNDNGGPDWEPFDGTATEFLAAVFTRRLRSEIFPDDFPGEDPEFSVLDD